ncbi:NUDIX hydrolase [Pseudooceanicola algae]|uniref:Uncharacterized protein n=1 Tax=Pseudooceanicola algae TaxID=1537215 RepID=A0A418SFX1_9RHOB|nr:NUDIX hydrolase [Pseudooceanicola algae]QPM91570.1 hypothetical protein PSAL_028250 [Pseudooceanicola algae]
MFAHFWFNYVRPLMGRPPMFQVAALCYRGRGEDMEILVVTSRETRRWILPKGWPKTGYDAADTALEEAWEEAGIKQRSMKPIRIGRYHYDKRLDGGLPAATEVDVYAVEIDRLLDDYPEVGQRERRWVRPAEAARLVQEEELKTLLRQAPALVAARLKGRAGH